MAESETVPVVIVGAGPTGTTAAALLGRYGVQCLVLDRWAGVYPQPRAVHLDDEVYRILGALGLADAFAGISRPALGLRLLDQNMKVLAEFRRDPTASSNGFPQANMFDQPALEALLRANLAQHPSVRLRGNAEVTSVRPSLSGRTRVTFTDRTTGGEHTADARYVLGCDGANSAVRAAIGTGLRDLKFQQRWLVVDVATDAELDQWDGVHQVCNPDRAATYMRIGPRRYRWEFRLRAGESVTDFDAMDRLRPLIAPWIGDTHNADLELLRATEYTFRAMVAERWRDGNVFLLGDAAHLTPPFIGQGLGAGSRDAANLAWKLAAVLSDELSADVLDTYEPERKPHAVKMIGLALAVGSSMTSGGRVGNLLRGAIVPRLHRVPGMRARIVSSTTPPLGKTELVVKGHRMRRLAGTLCPNAALPDGTRLDDTLGHGFGVVTTEYPTLRQRDDLRGRGAVIVHTAATSELGAWLQRGGATSAIIRPDRAVMATGRRLETLCAAVPTFRTGRTGTTIATVDEGVANA